MRRSLIGLILAAALAPAAHGQAVVVDVVDVSDGAVQRFEIAGPARISYTGSTVVITFGPAPAPPIPTPQPPQPNPPQPAPPVPAEWGPLERVVILFESAKLTGREAIYSGAVHDALKATVPPDSTGRPRWRLWDKDSSAPDATSSVEAVDWSDALSDAKYAQKGSDDVILHAFDAKGRIKSIPLKGMTDEDAAKAIRDLGAAK